MRVIDALKIHLNDVFKLKDLSSLKYFLGLELFGSSNKIMLSQRNYTLQLLEDTDFLSSKPSALPIDLHVKLRYDDDTLL